MLNRKNFTRWLGARFYIQSCNFYPLLLFVFLSTAPFFWSNANSNFNQIGGADYPPMVNALANLLASLYPFNHLDSGGIDQAFLISAIPHHLFYYILSQIGVSPLYSTMALLSTLIFVAQASFFFALSRFAGHLPQLPLEKNAICVLGSILYGFSPYFIALVIPGHIMTLFVFAAFPLVIFCLDSLLTSPKFDIKSSLILFVIFEFCAPGFANIGIIYTLLIASFIYFATVYFARNLPFWRSSLRFSFFVILIFISNAWWLAPHLYNLKHYIAISTSTSTNLFQLVAYATKDANIVNIFQGKPESLMYMYNIVGNDYYVNYFISIIFLTLFALLIISSFEKHPQLRIFLLAALASAMFVKGMQPPFSDLFHWAYDHVPGFQIFRRPVAKFNGFFLFFILAGGTLCFGILLDKWSTIKWKKYSLIGSVFFSALYMVYIFIQTSSLTPFNIPDMYYKSGEHIIEDRVERALIVPSTNGLNPIYRNGMNSYTGQDFTNDVFRFPKISPDNSNNSLNEPYKKTTNKLMQAIREGNSICESTRELGISHIIVRDDLIPSNVEDKPRFITSVLDKHPEVIGKSIFTGENSTNLFIYKVKESCKEKLLHLVGNYSAFKYQVINPGKILIDIEGLSGTATLNFLTNFNTNWEVYLDESDINLDLHRMNKAPESFKFNFGELKYGFMKAPLKSSHNLSFNYANSWDLNDSYLKQQFDSTDINSTDTKPVNVKLVLFYKTQSYFYLGLIISLVSLLSLILYWLILTPHNLITLIFRKRSSD